MTPTAGVEGRLVESTLLPPVVSERSPDGQGVGVSMRRPDGEPKVRGTFAFASDLVADGMLWGATVRSPHPHARILAIDVSRAAEVDGVRAILTHHDVPGRKTYGLRVPDQPVLAWDVVRYQGEPVAVLAADDPETARRAALLVRVEYEVLPVLTDPEEAIRPEALRLHPEGNVIRHVRIRHGDVAAGRAAADVVVSGDYETAMQDPAYLGPEAGLAIPRPDGGVDLHVASQGLHEDLEQIAESVGLSHGDVRVILAGVGGAFGGREDVSVHIHACLLALRTGRPVKMVYRRDESFLAHVHRHPARLHWEHGATRDGRLVFVKALMVLDGGAYTSVSPVVIANGSYFSAGAYDVPNVEIDGIAVFTNNPPCGAMRGFGTVQPCFAVESNMDRLAAALGMDPVELRLRNAMRPGSILPTGQVVDGPAPVAEILRRLRDAPAPPPANGGMLGLPGGSGNVTHGEGIRRGVGYALGVKATGYSGGVDDSSTATVRLSAPEGEPSVEIRTAAADLGQGLTAVLTQIAATELGVGRVLVLPADTTTPNSWSSNASRQTWMAGGAVQGACRAIRRRLLQRADDDEARAISAVLGDGAIEETFEYRHRPTHAIDPEFGQGDAHVDVAFAGHRAVVDVDLELGLVRVVELRSVQDVGKAVNPAGVEGQIEGGTVQGLGLALTEEILLRDGKVANASFTDYLIPTAADVPEIRAELLEYPHPGSPYGLAGVGELPSLSSTAAIANAVRDATGLQLPCVPIRPDDIALCAREAAQDRAVAASRTASTIF